MKERFGVECNLQLKEIIDKNIKRTKKYSSHKCAQEGCKKWRQNRSAYCISHGGGNRCTKEGCTSSVRGADKVCVRHGGGKRCQENNCPNSAIGGFNLCKRHGGGHKCVKDGCITVRGSGDAFCWKHKSREKKDIKNLKTKARRKTDMGYRLVETLRSRMRCAFKGNLKKSTTVKLLGCTMDEFREHIAKQFLGSMSWENYGKWEIDHIRPCASFDFSTKKAQQECFHYSNTQPLWKRDNASKGDRYSAEYVEPII